MKLEKFLVTLMTCSLLASCVQKKERKVPEHVVQQKQREAQLKQKTVAAKKEHQETVKKSHNTEDKLWPAPVRLAFYQLYGAKIGQWPAAARQLAMLGLPAVPALERMAKNHRQPIKKRAIVSFLLVQIYSFRPEALLKLARQEELPFARRAAIESLARIGNPQTIKMLATIRKELKDAPPPKPAKPKREHSHGHGQTQHPPHPSEKTDPFGPMIDFIDQAVRNTPRLAYTSRQLALLDSVLHAKSPMELKVALEWLKDLTLEQGLMLIMRSPITSRQVHRAVLERTVHLAAAQPDKLRQYCKRGAPQPLRIAAVARLLAGKKPADRAWLKKISNDSTDPLVLYLRALLKGRRPQVPLPTSPLPR